MPLPAGPATQTATVGPAEQGGSPEVPLSFELLAGKPEQFEYALGRLCVEFDPSFVSIVGGKEHWPVASDSELSKSINHLPVSQVVPLIAWSPWARERSQDTEAKLDEYAARGIRTVIVRRETNGDKQSLPAAYTSARLVALARATRQFERIGVTIDSPDREVMPDFTEDADPEVELTFSPEQFETAAEALRLADFAVTSPIHSVESYLALLAALRHQDVSAPVIPGLQTLEDPQQIITRSFRQTFPEEFRQEINSIVEAHQDEPSILRDKLKLVDRRFNAYLGQKLIERRVPGLHIYTGNNVRTTSDVARRLNAA